LATADRDAGARAVEPRALHLLQTSPRPTLALRRFIASCRSFADQR